MQVPSSARVLWILLLCLPAVGCAGADGNGNDGGEDGDVDGFESCETRDDCAQGARCCSGHCSNTHLDPANCGACGNACPFMQPYCSNETCTLPPCTAICPAEKTCCGMSCCTSSQVCCLVSRGGPLGEPACYDGHCPAGCPLCVGP